IYSSLCLFVGGGGSDGKRYQLTGLAVQQPAEIRLFAYRFAVDGQDDFPRLQDNAAFVGRGAVPNLQNLEARSGVAFVEQEAQVGGDFILRRGGSADTQVRRIQLAQHQVHQVVKIFAQGDVLNQRTVLVPHSLPIDAVKFRIVKRFRK